MVDASSKRIAVATAFIDPSNKADGRLNATKRDAEKALMPEDPSSRPNRAVSSLGASVTEQWARVKEKAH